jgi:hypothetical protein
MPNVTAIGAAWFSIPELLRGEWITDGLFPADGHAATTDQKAVIILQNRKFPGYLLYSLARQNASGDPALLVRRFRSNLDAPDGKRYFVRAGRLDHCV